jgi:serine/threonine protein kinase
MINENSQPIRLRGDTYEILERLGYGAYGIVWKARRASDSETVALKTVQTHNPDDRTPYPTVILRQITQVLKWEIGFLEQLGADYAEKRHILPLLDSGEYENYPVMVLPLCERSLNHVYVQRRDHGFPFEGNLLLRWIGEISDALDALHHIQTEEGQFVHRDLKFNNVLMKRDALYLCDFGTVKIVEHEFTTSLAGTLNWGAPEMFIPADIVNGKPRYELSGKADLYSLGLVIYALLTGSFPSAQGKIRDYTSASGKPMPGAEKMFGTVGGLTPQERHILLRDIRSLFAEDKTLVPQEYLALPDTESLVDELAEMTESLLSPRADARPDARQVRELAGRFLDYLSPVLSALAAEIPENIGIREPCTVRMTAQGKGLPGNARWLHLRIAGKTADSEDIRERGENAWELMIPGFETVGTYEIEAFALIRHQKISDVKQLKVSASPEQLWAEKQFAQALMLSPDRGDWLDFLEKRAKKRAGFRRDYLQILEKVRAVHPEHTDINRRYWSMRHESEAENEKKQRSFRWAVVLLLLILAIPAGVWVKIRSQPSPLFDSDVEAIVEKYYFNKSGNFKNDFVDNGNGTVTDRATGLTWQKGGSNDWLTYKQAQDYIRDINRKKFVGYSDWRLPTLEELLSLMETQEVNGLYIDPVFDRTQEWCWSIDNSWFRGALYVRFKGGGIAYDHLHSRHSVRAVRPGQWRFVRDNDG